MTVVDASVAAKWYLLEAGSSQALKLLDSNEPLFAPLLIRIEVAAAIFRHYRNGEITKARAAEAYGEWIRALAEGTITLVPDDELFDDSRDLALQLRHTFQDCLYLACANRLGRPLLTADKKFHERASPKFAAVKLLAGSQSN